MPDRDIEAFLDFLQEPVFIVTSAAAVLRANAAAKRLLGADPTGRNLTELITSPAEELRAYLRRCSGTAAPLVGALTLALPDGTGARLRTHGARLPGPPSGPVRLALRGTPVQADEFSVLARKVRELNAEIHERRRTQAALEETLDDNRVLMRELHHRVRNNIQLMLGLFSAAKRDTASPEAQQILEQARQRLLSIGAVQQLMYQSQDMRAVPAGSFLAALCEAMGATLGPGVRVEVAASEDELSNDHAFPLALILNELLTNAAKHGLRDGRGTVRVALRREGPEFVLVVHDDGPGFIAGPERRSSGLGLVRGLCRQIGGAVEIENDGGARCTIRFSAGARQEDAS
ncbi:sensor histidine kinase [Arenibaculum sp.]|jgi:two-component sensor histidine kinase|uniref:sensor histidine kinase n=1 Tax=Arenibaculum sp. TaxID=2865862 RepID=UPI002E10CD75|nr:sensor histidine kinase [Arenibaculum sp.]